MKNLYFIKLKKEYKYYIVNIIMLREKNDIKSSKIIGVQFSILSPDEIRNAVRC